MKIAGRVLIISRGEYDPSKTYKMLDMVTYDYTSWICKEECVGIEPNNTNMRYWHHVTDIGLVNNLDTVVEGFALDARLGRYINNELETNRSNMDVIGREFRSLSIVVNTLLGTSVAEDYDNEKTYSEDSYVIYYNNLYKCIIPVETPEEFDELKWAKCYVMDELNEKVAEIVEDIANGEVSAELGDILGSIAPTFSHAGLYFPGDYVRYNGTLYKCIAETRGEFDETKWNSCNLADEITGTNESMKEIASDVSKAQSDIGELSSDMEGAYGHLARVDNPHSVTKEQVGLGNVPNVSTNNQTPTFSFTDTLQNLVSGETLSDLLGKIGRAVNEFINHKKNSEIHVTASDKGNWDSKADPYFLASTFTDGLMSAADKMKLDGIESGATKTTVLDSVQSVSKTDALSANTGHFLYGKITNLITDTSTAKAIADACWSAVPKLIWTNPNQSAGMAMVRPLI